jgi:hypothetical protein
MDQQVARYSGGELARAGDLVFAADGSSGPWAVTMVEADWLAPGCVGLGIPGVPVWPLGGGRPASELALVMRQGEPAREAV